MNTHSMIVAAAVQQSGGAILCEPVMSCEISVPLSHLGPVLTDLTSNRYM